MIVDIVVPTYHRYEILAEALESVRSQTYPHWKCWIAEDGASDKTHATVKPFLADPRFRYLPGPHAGTPAAPRNRALRAGHGPLVAFLDDDDIWLADKLEKQVAFLNSHPGCILLGCNAWIMREDQDYRKDNLPLYFKKAPFGRVSYAQLAKDDYFINSGAVMRRWTLALAGLQNEQLHKGPDGEDYDLWLRIGALGERWIFEEPLVIYREFSTKHAAVPKPAKERRKEAYHTKFKIYRSAMDGVGELPSPLLFPENHRQGQICRQERDFYGAGPRFVGRLRHDIGSALAHRFYLPPSKKKQRQAALESFAACRARWEPLKPPFSAGCVIFSKDRALQLHALLSGFVEKVTPAVPVHVLYRTSSDGHRQAYDELESLFAGHDIRFVRQTGDRSFKNHLLEILFSMTCDRLFFLVDDMVFTEPLDINDLLRFNPDRFVPSLRMGKNLSRCYVVQQGQPLPPFEKKAVDDPDKIVWQWSRGALDWSYPLSVDGHFFARREVAAMAALIPFSAPNSFEDRLQVFRPLFLNRLGIGYEKSKVVNIPCNRVQNEIPNLSGNTHPDILLEKWRQGYRLKYEDIYGLANESVHQEVALPLILREQTQNRSNPNER